MHEAGKNGTDMLISIAADGANGKKCKKNINKKLMLVETRVRTACKDDSLYCNQHMHLA